MRMRTSSPTTRATSSRDDHRPLQPASLQPQRGYPGAAESHAGWQEVRGSLEIKRFREASMIQLRELTPQERRIYCAANNHDLGTEIATAREKLGRTVTDAAALAGIHRTTWHAIERGDGNPRLSTLLAVGRSLNSPARQP